MVIAIPTLQDVKVERDGDKRVRLEITKGQSDRLVNPNEVLRVIGRPGDDRRSAELAEDLLATVRRCDGGDGLRPRACGDGSDCRPGRTYGGWRPSWWPGSARD